MDVVGDLFNLGRHAASLGRRVETNAWT
jgi:hypothetical protein